MERDPEIGTVSRLPNGQLIRWHHGDFLMWDGTDWREPDLSLTVDRLMESQRLSREEIQRLKETGVFSEANVFHS